MSDAKGEEKSAAGSSGPAFAGADALFWILLAMVVMGIVQTGLGAFGMSFGVLPSLSSLLASFFGVFQVFSVFLSLVFVIGIIYFTMKLNDLLHHAHHGHGHGEGSHGHHAHEEKKSVSPGRTHNKRWENIEARIASSSDADWRLAILECDIILDEMLTKMGYHGEGIGEKLKIVEKSDFNTLDEAWEAHKIRNRIAHDGASYKLSRSEAERVIHLYKKVFEEFHFV